VQAEDLQVDVPTDPHFELVVDSSTSLHFSNPHEPYTWENDLVQGSYFVFHAPTSDANSRGPNGMDYRDYFSGKSRIWELRLQFKFKRQPHPDWDMFFGVELEDYVPLSMATKQAQRFIIAGVNQAVGGLYQSPGTDPSKMTAGDPKEQPCCVVPLWAFDQFVVTPENEQPPNLGDPEFPSFGNKRYRRVSEYAKEIRALKEEMTVGPTYTFGFWGTARFLDVMNWTVIGIPAVTPLDFNRFAGRPPVFATFYALKPSKEGEHRHLENRKEYIFRAAIWSSTRRPERSHFERLAGTLACNAEAASTEQKKKTGVRKRLAVFWKALEGCTQRMKE